MVAWKVYFANGHVHMFQGFWKSVMQEVDQYCTAHNTVTTQCMHYVYPYKEV